MALTREEFQEIRVRRSQDDLNALIAHVEEQFGIAPPPVVVEPAVAAEPQLVVTVAPAAEPDAPKKTKAKK